jgi:hypothetical protein
MRAPTSRLECSGGWREWQASRRGKLRERLEKEQASWESLEQGFIVPNVKIGVGHTKPISGGKP